MSRRTAASAGASTVESAGGRLDGLVARLVAPVERRLPGGDAVARLGLGAMLGLAGVHKLLAPTAWTVYVADWLAPLLVVSPAAFMLANGVIELLFGGLLLANRSVVFAAFVAAVSLSATVAYLAVLGLDDGRFLDVLIRDVGLAALAWVVLVDGIRGRREVRVAE